MTFEQMWELYLTFCIIVCITTYFISIRKIEKLSQKYLLATCELEILYHQINNPPEFKTRIMPMGSGGSNCNTKLCHICLGTKEVLITISNAKGRIVNQFRTECSAECIK